MKHSAKKKHSAKISITDAYKENFEMHLDHLQHSTQLFILLNVSLFFLTQLVIKEGYYYTFYSLFCLGIVQLILILPLRIIRELWFYWCLFIVELIGIYYFLSSVIYWISTNKGV